jgi:chaperonin GroEL (HSP60 family)
MGSRPGGDHLARLCLRAVQLLWRFGGHNVSLSRIKLEPLAGGLLSDSQLIRGAIVGRNAAHDTMPSMVHNARVAVLSGALEPPRLRTKHTVTVQSVGDLHDLDHVTQQAATAAVDAILACGATVFVRFCFSFAGPDAFSCWTC